MEQYECVCTDSRFLYMAEDLAEAMSYHNRQSPEHREKVLYWIGPTGIRFQFHDSKMGIGRTSK